LAKRYNKVDKGCNVMNLCNLLVIDQLRGHNNSSPADLWRRASSRGHSGVTLRSSPTTR